MGNTRADTTIRARKPSPTRVGDGSALRRLRNLGLRPIGEG